MITKFYFIASTLCWLSALDNSPNAMVLHARFYSVEIPHRPFAQLQCLCACALLLRSKVAHGWEATYNKSTTKRINNARLCFLLIGCDVACHLDPDNGIYGIIIIISIPFVRLFLHHFAT